MQTRRRLPGASILAIQLVLIAACATPPDPAPYTSATTPESWRRAADWEFEITDPDERPLGRLTLRLTSRPSRSCGEPGWRRAVIIDDRLDLGIGVVKNPAFRIVGPWLVVDLTSTTCSAGHRLVGDLYADRAEGFFNYAHRLGGENLGRFVARPAP
ncbi:MAG: hypothetical protein OEW35_04775 [Gammaproteobacteria bacterium]|nr:hypothetical protein [Gammaproteobacteria bacterium]MDH4256357.1 hypothetical protein [Gammaproteobacteria bacterium]MDH5309113.1 hypothetical protein [Gammaproteobacteria bacterium]